MAAIQQGTEERTPMNGPYLALNNVRIQHTANIIEPDDVQYLKDAH